MPTVLIVAIIVIAIIYFVVKNPDKIFRGLNVFEWLLRAGYKVYMVIGFILLLFLLFGGLFV